MPDPKLASPILRMISHAIGTLFPKMKVPAVSKYETHLRHARWIDHVD